MAYTDRVYFEVLRVIDSSTLDGSYIAIGGPLLNHASIIKFTNNSTSDVTVSYDAVEDVDILLSGAFTLYDISTNHALSNSAFFQSGTQFFVKGEAGTGNIYLTIIYINKVSSTSIL